LGILNTAIGDELSPLVKPPLTQEQLRRYAQASGDSNPIHLDEEAAHRVGLGGVIAHGMLSMAFLGQFVASQVASLPGAYLASLNVRFMSMVRLGDTLTCRGHVTARGEDAAGQLCVGVECWVQNQRGEQVTVGTAVVAVPPGPEARNDARGEA
jgi:acyl dehydratase